MHKKTELSLLDVNMLAIYCSRVAEWNTATPLEAQRARELKSKWVAVINVPPSMARGGPDADLALIREQMLVLLSSSSMFEEDHQASFARATPGKAYRDLIGQPAES